MRITTRGAAAPKASRTFRALAVLAALGAFAAAAWTGHYAFVLLALPALFLLATSLSIAGGLTRPLERYRGHALDVRIWGAPLPGSPDVGLTLTSVKALGAGLHLFFESSPAGAPTHLKIAQPAGVLLEPERIVIDSARYVQWGGRKLHRVAGAPAVIIAIARIGAPARAPDGSRQA